MPVIDGKVHRSRFTSLKLRELSSVDNPAQPGARMAIMKRHDPAAPDRAGQAAELAKYICPDDGAVSFQTVLADTKFDQNVWPCVDALSQSIRSIVGDSSLAGGERDAQINSSVQQFLQSVRDISPEISKQLEPLLVRKREEPMAKTVEELEKQVGDLTGQLTSANALVTAEKARADKAEGELTAEKSAHGETKKALTAATEEVLKVGEVEVKKSEVGVAQFNLTKGLQDEALTARLEKRAGEEFPHVVGTSAEKALVLKSVNHLPEDSPTRKALEAILTSAEKMIASGFERIGGSGGPTPTEKAAKETFDGKVKEVMARDKCTKSAAMTKARNEFPAEFAAAHPDSAPAATAAN
jgi:hypothetical protein